MRKKYVALLCFWVLCLPFVLVFGTMQILLDALGRGFTTAANMIDRIIAAIIDKISSHM